MQDALKELARFFYISSNCIDRAQKMALWARRVKTGGPESHVTLGTAAGVYNPNTESQRQEGPENLLTSLAKNNGLHMGPHTPIKNCISNLLLV